MDIATHLQKSANTKRLGRGRLICGSGEGNIFLPHRCEISPRWVLIFGPCAGSFGKIGSPNSKPFTADLVIVPFLRTGERILLSPVGSARRDWSVGECRLSAGDASNGW